MNNFLVVTNSLKDPDLHYTNLIRDFMKLNNRRCETETKEECGAIFVPEETECVIVLGGDGTLLRTAREIVGKEVPLIGVNLGTLGYLAEVESSNLEAALKRLIDDDYTLEKRMMLCGAKSSSENEEIYTSYALNDITLTRCGQLQVIPYHVTVNGQYLTSYQADGIILSSPTGSTGYNLSAGGPIVDPRAEALLLTPVCPHSMGSRSIVLSATDVISIEIGEGRKGAGHDVEVSFDGSEVIPFKTGDRIEISKADRYTNILKLSKASFLDILHKKMSSE